jgi:hypothetical protein
VGAIHSGSCGEVLALILRAPPLGGFQLNPRAAFKRFEQNAILVAPYSRSGLSALPTERDVATYLGCDHYTSTEPSQQAYWNFQRHVDRLCLLIVASGCSDREIDIERLHLRVQAATLFLRCSEFVESCHIDHNHCERVQSLGLVHRKKREIAGISVIDSNNGSLANPGRVCQCSLGLCGV